MTLTVAAVDLGASSGRVVLGEVGRGVLRVETAARFGNEPVWRPDGLHWDIDTIHRQVLDGLGEAARRAGGALAGIAVDSWAADYGLVRDGQLLAAPFCYRDGRGAGGAVRVHRVVGPDALYRRNGLQFLPFNTVFQLAADPRVTEADRLLLIPDLIGYWLTGRTVSERTNASTTGLLHVHTRDWDDELVARLGLPRGVLAPLVDPGHLVGPLLPEVAGRIGTARIPVTAVGSHDTASAVVGVPMQTDDAAYVSCGTWGLVGVELEHPLVTEASRSANFTNEGGVDGRIRFLTNVMGLWLLSETLRTWASQGHAERLADLLDAAGSLRPTARTFDVQDPRFLPPGDMPERIRQWYREAGLDPPASRPALVRAIVDSLAEAFAEALDTVEQLTGKPIRVVHLVGGGALNRLLCQAAADRSGREVCAGPVEATAIGNVLVQARAAGAVRGGLEQLRRLVADTVGLTRYLPRPSRRT